MRAQYYDEAEVLDLCIHAGSVMLANGAETYRVEDTLYRIAASYGLTYINVFVVPTAIILTVQGEKRQDYTELLRTSSGSTNLQKVTAVNDLSREISATPLPPEVVRQKLTAIEMHTPEFTRWQRTFGVSLACACFVFLFGGGWMDFVPAGIAAGFGMNAFEKVDNFFNVTFFAQIVASFVTGIIAMLFVQTGWGNNLDTIIVSALMGLVPGMAITNSFRDLMAGHLVAGISLLAQALLTAAAIGVGIVLVLALF